MSPPGISWSTSRCVLAPLNSRDGKAAEAVTASANTNSRSFIARWPSPNHDNLQGDLSLLATGGGGGVPNGHVLAWKADHALHAKFLRELASKIEAQ